MTLDRTSEEIAHFIGLFRLLSEDARLRGEYREFEAPRLPGEEAPELPTGHYQVRASFELVGFDPALHYQPVGPELVQLTALFPIDFQPPDVPWTNLDSIAAADFKMPVTAAAIGSLRLSFTIDPPGSIVTWTSQNVRLGDDDYVGVGDHNLIFAPVIDFSPEMAALLSGAMQIAPVGDHVGPPGSEAAMESFVLDAPGMFEHFAENPQDTGGVFAHEQDTITGIYVNGESAEETPTLADHLPAGTFLANTVADGEPESGSAHLKPPDLEASVTLEMGGNTLMNSASLANNWLGSSLIAVGGGNYEVNAIIQINAWMDSDMVSAQLDGWDHQRPNSTQAFNIAEFERVEYTPEGKPAGGGAPFVWSVATVEGDLVIMNWMEQFTFMTDNDVAVASSSGVKTFVKAGGNTALNEINMYEIGFYYDLMVVGGNIYDMNLIQQMNVLLDNDVVGAVNGFETEGPGSVSTSGNLLWNEAKIVNMGGSDRFDALPAAYSNALKELKNGKSDSPGEFLQDPAFAGLLGIKMLHITGDILDLQFVKQTNILGDADQVALAMDAVKGRPDAEWQISTGKNVLANKASIHDADALGATYVGDSHYSYELLVQTDIVGVDPDLGGQDPDQLVNEAVAFLDDGMIGPKDGHGNAAPIHNDHAGGKAAQDDVMQSMLA